jgi:hypothetical protein
VSIARERLPVCAGRCLRDHARRGAPVARAAGFSRATKVPSGWSFALDRWSSASTRRDGKGTPRRGATKKARLAAAPIRRRRPRRRAASPSTRVSLLRAARARPGFAHVPLRAAVPRDDRVPRIEGSAVVAAGPGSATGSRHRRPACGSYAPAQARRREQARSRRSRARRMITCRARAPSVEVSVLLAELAARSEDRVLACHRR